MKIYSSAWYYPFEFISFILFWFFLLDIDWIVRVEIYSLNLHQFDCLLFILVCRSYAFKNPPKYLCLSFFLQTFNIELFQLSVPLISNNVCQCEMKWILWMRRAVQSKGFRIKFETIKKYPVQPVSFTPNELHVANNNNYKILKS